MRSTQKRLEKSSEQAETLSAASMHVHHRWAQAMTLIQISIALSAISLLTRKRVLLAATAVAAAGGLAIGALAAAHL